MKKVIALLLALLMVLSLAGCNRNILDTTYYFDHAIISLPDGEVVSGKVDKWSDYEGDQIQIVIDGTTYLVHSADAVLIAN